MIDVTTLSPEHIKRLQTPAQGSPCGCNDCRRQRVLDRLKADVQSGAYRDDGPELDASLDKLQAAIDATKGAVDADDAVEHAERWDGLS
jgi:hypothetical protein